MYSSPSELSLHYPEVYKWISSLNYSHIYLICREDKCARVRLRAEKKIREKSRRDLKRENLWGDRSGQGGNWIYVPNWCLIKELVQIISLSVIHDAINHSACKTWLAHWSMKASIKALSQSALLALASPHCLNVLVCVWIRHSVGFTGMEARHIFDRFHWHRSRCWAPLANEPGDTGRGFKVLGWARLFNLNMMVGGMNTELFIMKHWF